MANRIHGYYNACKYPNYDTVLGGPIVFHAEVQQNEQAAAPFGRIADLPGRVEL